jgi:hypothetical protein
LFRTWILSFPDRINLARTWDRIFSCRLQRHATTPDTTACQPELYNALAARLIFSTAMHDSFGSLGPHVPSGWSQEPATRILLYIQQIRIPSLSYHHVPTANLTISKHASPRPVVHVTTSLTGHVRIHIYSNGILLFFERYAATITTWARTLSSRHYQDAANARTAVS